MNEYRAIIIGGGMVAGYAAKEWAEQGGKAGELAIVSADNSLPYERPPLSKSFLAGKDDEQSVLINPESFYQQHGIDVYLNETVTRIDTAARRVHTSSGKEFGYQQLLLATGARVRTLNVTGAGREKVLYLRSLADAARLRDAIKSTKCVAVAGGSFIGMEVASQCAQQGRETTMIFPEERVWQIFFTPEMSRFFERYYHARGVRLMARTKVENISNGSIALSTGAKFTADLVIAGAGVAPVVDIAKDAGIQTGNGIVTNESLETSVPGVFAGGDVAQFRDARTGKSKRLEHWDNAVKQGQYLAHRLHGETKAFDNVPYFFSDVFDLSYEFWGDAEGSDHTEVKGDIGSKSFSVWWLKGYKVLAAFVMNRPDAERESASKLSRDAL